MRRFDIQQRILGPGGRLQTSDRTFEMTKEGTRISLNVEVSNLFMDLVYKLNLFCPHARLTHEMLKVAKVLGLGDMKNKTVYLVFKKSS